MKLGNKKVVIDSTNPAIVQDVVMRVAIFFQQDILGSQPGDPNLHSTYISSKAPDAEEREAELEAIEDVAEQIEKGTTVFYRDKNGNPCIAPYQVLGFLKAAQGALNDGTDKAARKDKGSMYLTAYKKVIANDVMVKATDAEWAGGVKFIPINIPEDGVIGELQRPLMIEAFPQNRVALAHSETCPAGSWAEFDVKTKTEAEMDRIRFLLHKGCEKGLGQWRNAGYGKFVWCEVNPDTEEPIPGTGNCHLE